MLIKVKTGSESTILSVGAYRPSRLVPNSEIVDLIDSSDEWIVQRTGIESRRFASADESVVDMAIGAAEQALTRAKLTIKDIDTVVVATITYPHQAPSAATAIIQRMGKSNCGCARHKRRLRRVLLRRSHGTRHGALR